MRLPTLTALAALALAACGEAVTEPAPDSPAATPGESPVIPTETEFTRIDGQPLPFSQFSGQAVLVVNTASRCGYTPQYEGLQALWERYRDDGLVVLGVPSNDFGGQEPGTEAEVKEFCEINYGVDFPLTAKTTVIGPDRHVFYAAAEAALGEAARPNWNFHKVLVGPDGAPLKAFPSAVKPDDPALIAEIEAALAG